MSVNERIIDAPAEAVWEVLSNGWLYPLWVVGASRIRGVEDAWPAQGARLHHSVGLWPALIDDHTQVVESDPPRRMALRAKGWPVGEADVVIELEPAGNGTRVRIREDAAAGPGRLVPNLLRQPVLKIRNVETLRRLAYLVEGRAR